MCNVTYHNVCLRGLRVLEKDNSLWLGMPSRKRGERWEDIYFFPNADERQLLLSLIEHELYLEDNPKPKGEGGERFDDNYTKENDKDRGARETPFISIEPGTPKKKGGKKCLQQEQATINA